MKKRESYALDAIFILTCINIFYIALYFEVNRYLPPPFFHDKQDTFMDFYNTMYWAGHEGIYDVWNSIYPPINFIILKIYQFLFMGEVAHDLDGFAIRGQDNITPLLFIYIISLIIAIEISYSSIVDLKRKFIIIIIFLFSPPFLFALERGNLIILCLPVVSWLLFSKNKISRSLALALLINLKPYFFIFYIIQLLNVKSHQENKEFLFLSPVFSLILFLVTGLILNQEFYLIPVNILGFAANSAILSPENVLSFPSSIASFSHLRGLASEFRLPPILGYLAHLVVWIYLIKTILLIYKKNISFEDLFIFSIIFLTNYSTSTGGYGLLYYIPTLPLFYKQKDWVLLITIVICIYIGIWDLIPIFQYNGDSTRVFLSGEMVKIEPFISLGSIIRPIANFAVLVLFFKNLEKRYLDAYI